MAVDGVSRASASSVLSVSCVCQKKISQGGCGRCSRRRRREHGVVYEFLLDGGEFKVIPGLYLPGIRAPRNARWCVGVRVEVVVVHGRTLLFPSMIEAGLVAIMCCCGVHSRCFHVCVSRVNLMHAAMLLQLRCGQAVFTLRRHNNSLLPCTHTCVRVSQIRLRPRREKYVCNNLQTRPPNHTNNRCSYRIKLILG